jgi:serine/threonine protein kinase
MGEVWRADDLLLGRTVAVKVLLPNLSGDPGFAERFRTEARAMAALSDPSIVEVYDYGQADGIAYLVMPFIKGESLHELLNRAGPLPPREAMTIVAQAANALQLAHQSGIVHRDVKPGNLLLRPDGRLVLTDFGIARIVESNQVTGADVAIGTAAYLAPEQTSGSRVAPATDIYSLGVVAYECLTLTRPFDADSLAGVALIHTRNEPPPLPDAIPSEVRQVVMRALAKDPEQRWPSAHAMAEAATNAARKLPHEPWFAAPEAPARRPAPTAALPTLLGEPRGRSRLRAGLIPIAAGVAAVVAATVMAFSGAGAPGGLPVPPASSVAPGDETLGNAQPPVPDQQEAGDRHGGDSGRGRDGSGHGGGDRGSEEDNPGPG